MAFASKGSLIITRSQTLIRYLVGSYARPNSSLGPMLRAIPLNATTQQVLGLERSEQRAYLENLWQFNHDRRPSATGNDQALYGNSKAIGFLRRFNQLPCTVESRRARADLLATVDKDTCRILVLGDDDLLSVELAQRGFRCVTVADCDDQLLRRIQAETATCATPPEILKADFHAGLTWAGQADIVFLDPPYSVAGAEAFLRLAIGCAAQSARLFLMINPFVVGRSFSHVIALAVHSGFHLKAQRPSFNGYPIGIFEATVLRLAWRYFLGLEGGKSPSGQLYFCSDCFEFSRE